MKYQLTLLSILLCLAVTFAAAQDFTPSAMSGHGRSGRLPSTVLSGSVHTLDGKPLRDVRVEVRMPGTGAAIASGYTLPNGSFEFNNVPQGTYEVVATLGVQQAHERVDVNQGDISLDLRLDGTGGHQTGGVPTVSVSQLKIPDKARKIFAKADEAFRKQKFDLARDLVQKALEAFPDYAQALTLRGILELQDNKLEQASASLEQSIKADYGYAMAYFALGATYNLMSRYDDAARVLERGIVLIPASWQGYFELSKALVGKGQFEAALRQVNKAVDLAPPKFGAVHLVKAHALLGIKDYNHAVMELEQYLGTEPNGTDSANARQTLTQVRALLAASPGK